MTQQPMIKFRDGVHFPQLGYGTYLIDDARVGDCVATALETGYRHVDTAAFYENERGIGERLRNSDFKRSDYQVTSKIFNGDHGYDRAFKAFSEIEARLDIGAIDLILIHWPMPKRDLYVETWKALIDLQKQGRIISIGVSNFTPEHLKRIIDETGVVPVVNQIELHPAFQQHELRAFHAEHDIVTESWSPLGRGAVAENAHLRKIGDRYGKTPVQVVIRWHLQHGFMVVPKTETPERIRANFDVFDFTLEAAEMAVIDEMDTPDGRIGPDPETMG